jgi:hypothetical protein
MQKFTKISKEKEEIYEKNYTPVWEKGSQRVVDYEGWSVFVEADKVCCLPFLQEYNSILLRLEPIPSYKLRNQDQTEFLTCFSETIEPGETVEEALRRGLVEEMGIKLNSACQVDIERGLYQFKGGDTMAHTCLLPLMEHDYLDVPILTDGSIEEKKSKIVKVDLKYLATLMPADITTAYLINKLRLHLKG